MALEFPDALRSLHVHFQRAGSDIVEAFYFAGEAIAAAEIAKASGLPVVLTLAPMAFQEMADGVGIIETAQRLEQLPLAMRIVGSIRGALTPQTTVDRPNNSGISSCARPFST